MLLTIIILSIIAFMIWKLVIQDEGNALDQLPGPPRKPVIGTVLEFVKMDSATLFVKMRQYMRDYGDRYVVKIFKRRILHVCSPNDVEGVLSHSKNISKSKPYSFLQPWLGTGLLLSTGTKWHQRRKILTPTFHFNILKNFSVVIEEKSQHLVSRLRASAGEEVDIMQLMSDFTLYTICETAMGTQLDSDKSASTVAYKSAIKEIGFFLLSRLTRVWLHNDFVFRQLPIGKRFEVSLKKVHSFADNVIIERKKIRKANGSNEASNLATDDVGSKKRMAMLDLLLEAEENGEIDLEGIREEVNTFMFEGHDTTAMALTFCLKLLADHPDVQDRIYEECTNILGDTDRSPDMNDLGEMRYLEAVIKETLRLYPSVPFIARTITEDFMLGDLPMKKGTEVAVHIYDLHRRADLYPDPEEFRPERFLSGETRHPYAFVPFSAGPRNCIGQRFAMLEMKCALSGLCRALRVSSRDARPPPLLADLVLRPARPVHLVFTPR